MFRLLNYFLLILIECKLVPQKHNILIWSREAAICPSAGRGFAEHVPAATRKTPLLDGELLEHVSTEICRFPGNVSVHTATNLQSRVRGKNSITLLLKEVIAIRFDHNLPQGENTTEDKQKSEEEVKFEVFILCGVVTVTFRVSPLVVLTKCCSYIKTALQLIAFPPGEYPINRFI
jgi:hypothetical protein